MASIGSGFRTIGAGISAAKMNAEQQQSLKDQLRDAKQNADEAFRQVAETNADVQVIYDVWMSLQTEVQALRSEITELRNEIQTLKGQSYAQNMSFGMPERSIMSDEYFNRY